ncbi:Hypothetical protein FKW44_013742 [Caligus rogercresseyi]|uniref:Uncharacterized protein n=1 Tax=Caligus rogercresseyi TaxID=217165 RepID=A0A7T8GY10_CALRO|nr:Hypothetical protein FKW44_013742 [Caligus rogercresseyi]
MARSCAKVQPAVNELPHVLLGRTDRLRVASSNLTLLSVSLVSTSPMSGACHSN